MKCRTVIGVSAGLLAYLLGAVAARADSLSCDGQLVHVGATMDDVRAVCGEPSGSNHRVEYHTIRQRGACRTVATQLVCDPDVEKTAEFNIDDWTYDFGRNRLRRHLRFEQGTLVRITTGS